MRVIKKAKYPPHRKPQRKTVNIPSSCGESEYVYGCFGIRFFICFLEVLTIAKLEHQLNEEIQDKEIRLPASGEYVGALWGARVTAQDGYITVTVKASSGEIWLPAHVQCEDVALKPIEQSKPVEIEPVQQVAAPVVEEAVRVEPKPECKSVEAAPSRPKAFEEMSVEELQEAILECMRRNGPVTEYMLGTVRENTHHGSLLNWVRSFR